jgi:MFS family permease
MAAVLMIATLPGRTHGLGLFTEPLLRSFQLDRESYGVLNLWATLLGASFCLPCGWLLDRWGTRPVAVLILLCLSGSVLALSIWTGGTWGLFLWVLLTRGFGQSALSVCSLALVGSSTSPRSGWGLGVYACLVSVGFVAAFTVLTQMVKANPEEWRIPWRGLGFAVLGVAALSLVAIPNVKSTATQHLDTESSRSLGEAIRSGEFWLFAGGTAFYGLVTSGTSLFNESILAERGFSKEIFLNVTIVGIPAGLAANLLGGWLLTWVSINRFFAVALLLLAATLFAYPRLREEWQAYLYAIALGGAGGAITVCFFAVWARRFGTRELGRIQGAAQLLTVLFSAVGPLIFATSHVRWGGYTPLFQLFAGLSLLLAVWSWLLHHESTRIGEPGA